MYSLPGQPVPMFYHPHVEERDEIICCCSPVLAPFSVSDHCRGRSKTVTKVVVVGVAWGSGKRGTSSKEVGDEWQCSDSASCGASWRQVLSTGSHRCPLGLMPRCVVPAAAHLHAAALCIRLTAGCSLLLPAHWWLKCGSLLGNH